jgi:hypothetical protein
LELLKGDETIRSRSLLATEPQAKSFERDGLADLRKNPLAKSSIPTLFDAKQRATSDSRRYGHSRDTAVYNDLGDLGISSPGTRWPGIDSAISPLAALVSRQPVDGKVHGLTAMARLLSCF